MSAPGAAAPAGGEAISQAGERRSSQVESLRALAALAVLFGHLVVTTAPGAGRVPRADLSLFEKAVFGGRYGVYFFFALTGYLIFWPFAKRYFGSGDAVDHGRYALNRAFRILPLYYVVVVVVLALQYDASHGTWLRFLTFGENFSQATVAQYVGPIWSLVLELQFYLLLPFLAWGLARLAGGSRRTAALALLGVGAALAVVRYRLVYGDPPPDPIEVYNMPANFQFFIPGMLLALLRLSWEERRPGWLRGALGHADAWILASLPLFAVVVLWRYSLDAAVGLAAFLVIGACVLPLHQGRLAGALRWRPLAVLGIASYSLYLWHVPIIHELATVDGIAHQWPGVALVAAPVCVAVALASYWIVEAPFLRLRRQWSRAAAPKEAG